MDVVGIDISKLKFDVVLIIGERSKHAVFSNTEAGFQQLLAWLGKQRPDPACSLHACMEATGNWGARPRRLPAWAGRAGQHREPAEDQGIRPK